MVGGSKTRAHSFKVREEMFKRDQRNNLFTQRSVGIWDTLPEGWLRQVQLQHIQDTWSGSWIGKV